jgi:hypothetical protein
MVQIFHLKLIINKYIQCIKPSGETLKRTPKKIEIDRHQGLSVL